MRVLHRKLQTKGVITHLSVKFRVAKINVDPKSRLELVYTVGSRGIRTKFTIALFVSHQTNEASLKTVVLEREFVMKYRQHFAFETRCGVIVWQLF